MRKKWLEIKRKLFPKLITSKQYIEILKNRGIQIGVGTYFFSPDTTTIDMQRPYLLTIGDYCKIAAGVKILAHDYSRAVLRMAYGDIIGEAKETVIGKNVFIGIDAIILMGAHIGNNVIIGAGSVVSGNIPDNVVIAGNPARIIRTLEEHYQIRKSKYVEEAKQMVRCMREKGISPTIENMGAFFPIYLKRDQKEIVDHHLNINLNGDDTKDILTKFLESDPIYSSFEEFLKDC